MVEGGEVLKMASSEQQRRHHLVREWRLPCSGLMSLAGCRGLARQLRFWSVAKEDEERASVVVSAEPMAQQPCWPPLGPGSMLDVCISPPSPADPGSDIVVNTLQSEEVSSPFGITSPTFHGGGLGSKDEKRLYQKLQEYAESCSSSDNEGFQDAEDKLDDEICHPPQCNGLDSLKDNVDSESDIVDSVLGDNQSDSATLELSSNISSVISSPIAEEIYNENTSAFTPCEATLMSMEKIISEFESAFLTERSTDEVDNHCPHDSAFEDEFETTHTSPHIYRNGFDSEIVENFKEDATSQEDRLDAKQTIVPSEAIFDNAAVSSPKEKSDLLLKEDDCLKEGKVLLRSTSLKTGKTPPGTPHRKKIVRFADALGLDLEDVKHIVSDELPNIPSSAFSDLKLKDVDSKLNFPTFEFRCNQPSWSSPAPNEGTVPQRTLYPEFIQPGTMPNFMERVRGQKTCLENVVVTDMTAHCIVRVLNIGFEKNVTLRVTTNEWATYNDVTAGYVSGDSVTDRFAANLLVPHVSPGQRVVFAVRYNVNGAEHWDSNNGANYVMRCQQGTAVAPPSTQSPDPPWIHHFL